MHKWKYYGERVYVVWREPGFLPGTKVTKGKHVLSERECLRCGIKERRKFFENLDGTCAVVGWEKINENNEQQ
jgi:hypothetical protein